MQPSKQDILLSALDDITKQYDADILVYVGFLLEPDDDTLIKLCRDRPKKRKNFLLILSTPGGSADCAYRIARSIQRAYKVRADNPTERGIFYLYVHDLCKSAGTLLALGASTLIMSQAAQLGPIDVQLLKEEEVGERRSGLTPRVALETLGMEAGRTFNRLFRYMRFDGRMQLSTKMAAELAAHITVGVMEPVYAQLDPMRLGEVERFVRISQEYGDRLRTPNVRKGSIEKLLGGYPSHEFVIDREEASDLFERVERPTDRLELVALTFIRGHHPTADNMDSFIQFVNDPIQTTKDATEPNNEQPQPIGGAGAARARSGRRQVRSDVAGDQQSARAKQGGNGSLGEATTGTPS